MTWKWGTDGAVTWKWNRYILRVNRQMQLCELFFFFCSSFSSPHLPLPPPPPLFSFNRHSPHTLSNTSCSFPTGKKGEQDAILNTEVSSISLIQQENGRRRRTDGAALFLVMAHLACGRLFSVPPPCHFGTSPLFAHLMFSLTHKYQYSIEIFSLLLLFLLILFLTLSLGSRHHDWSSVWQISFPCPPRRRLCFPRPLRDTDIWFLF